MTATQDDMIAELQNANAALQARLDAALTQRNSDYNERVQHQAATVDVLKMMSASPGDARPPLELIARRAWESCNALGAGLYTFDGTLLDIIAYHRPDLTQEQVRLHQSRYPTPLVEENFLTPVIRDRRLRHVRDIDAYPEATEYMRNVGPKSFLFVPLLRDDKAIGVIGIDAKEPGGFSDAQVDLLKTFAEQAVIAIGSAETYRALQERTREVQESLEYQTATSDVLKAISRSTFDLQPVLDTLVQTAARLCDAEQAVVVRRDGDTLRLAANFGFPPEFEAYTASRGAIPIPPDDPTVVGRAVLEGRPVHIHDVAAVPGYPDVAIRLSKQRTSLGVPLSREGEVIGVILLARQRVAPFTDRQIDLVSTFADQAVIAIENTRLLTEQQEALRQQTATAEVLQVINASPGDLMPVFEAILEKAHSLCDIAQGSLEIYDGERFRAVAVRGLSDDFAAMLRQGYPACDNPATRPLIEGGRFSHIRDLAETDYSITRSSVELTAARTLLCVPLRRDDTLLGMIASGRRELRPFSEKEIALLENFAAQAVIAMENARLINEIRTARDDAEATLRELKTAQANLIQAEKMASLGQLTAGIAHEIKNPLNFVNNFSALSAELIDELREVLAPEPLGDTVRAEVEDLTALLKGNLEKVVQHGQRADGIVKSMLEHSRGVSGERRKVDINTLADEALNLAYHGARAQDQSFNITLERNFGEGVAPIEVNPQDITRVLLNIFSNGFYAATKRARNGGDAGFAPTLKVTTRDVGDAVEIRVRDNGTGIPAEIRDKLFQPFFTTKPSGDGTGLGLSITYDIVTQAHGGSIAVDSKVGEHSEFTIRLPRSR